MPRKARVLVPNCPHHIVQRGHNRNAVFLSDEDNQYYLGNLKEWKTELGIKLHAWCLMTNHIHLVVTPGEDAMVLSQLMKRINGKQASYVNRLEGRRGSLREGRYKASPIQTDSYLLSCCRYVELNPVRAGMVMKAADYPWSSYSERMGNPTNARPSMLNEDCCYHGLGRSVDERRTRYEQFVAEGITEQEKQWIAESVNRNQLTGNDQFVDEIEQRIGLRVTRRGRGRPRNDE